MAPKGHSRAYGAHTGCSMLAPDSWFPPEMVGRSPVAELISDVLPQAQACCLKICASSHFTCRSRSSFLPIWSSILLAFLGLCPLWMDSVHRGLPCVLMWSGPRCCLSD